MFKKCNFFVVCTLLTALQGVPAYAMVHQRPVAHSLGLMSKVARSAVGIRMLRVMNKPFMIPIVIGAVVGLSGLSQIEMQNSFHRYNRYDYHTIKKYVWSIIAGHVGFSLLMSAFCIAGKKLHMYPLEAQMHFKGASKAIAYSAVWWTIMLGSMIAAEGTMLATKYAAANIVFPVTEKIQEKWHKAREKKAFETVLKTHQPTTKEKQDQGNACAICTGPLNEKNKSVVKLKCGHIFCTDCIHGWFTQQQKTPGLLPSCPTCRGTWQRPFATTTAEEFGREALREALTLPAGPAQE